MLIRRLTKLGWCIVSLIRIEPRAWTYLQKKRGKNDNETVIRKGNLAVCSDALCLLVRKAAAILEREEEESWEIRSVWDYIDVSFPREEKELGGREGGRVESHFLLLFFQQLCGSLSRSLLLGTGVGGPFLAGEAKINQQRRGLFLERRRMERGGFGPEEGGKRRTVKSTREVTHFSPADLPPRKSNSFHLAAPPSPL